MKNKTHYNIISKYRTELMGIAIIWIYTFHFPIPKSILFPPLFFIKQAGYGGVDIFFFLSGFGLMHGMLLNNYSTGSFYYKRLLRILPAYWIIICIALIIGKISGGKISLYMVFLNFTTIGFWINKYKFDWFIPSLIASYIFFPLFYYAYSRSDRKLRLIFSIVIASLLLDILIIKIQLSYLLPFTIRIPIFLIGAHIGYISLKENRHMTSKEKSYYLLSLICGLIMLSFVFIICSFDERWIYGLFWYPFWFITLPLCIFLALTMERYGHIFAKNYFNKIRWLLIYCGSFSLEIYLIHTRILLDFKHIWSVNLIASDKRHLIDYLAYFIITLILAVLLNKITVMIQKSFTKLVWKNWTVK